MAFDRQLFINAWKRRYADYPSEDHWVEMRPITAPTSWFRVDDHEGAADRAEQLTLENHNVYLGVTPRSRRQGGSKNCVPGHWVWLDFDKDHLPENADKSRAYEYIMQLTGDMGLPKCVELIWSGRGMHAYWKLEEPLGHEEMGRFLKRFAKACKADRGAVGAERIMRAPGTVNQKNGEQVTLHYLDSPFPERWMKLDLKEDPLPDDSGGDGPDYERPSTGEQFAPGERHSRLLAEFCSRFREIARTTPLSRETAEIIAAGITAIHAPTYPQEEPEDYKSMVDDAYDLIMSDIEAEQTNDQREELRELGLDADFFTATTTANEVYRVISEAISDQVRFTGAEWLHWDSVGMIWREQDHVDEVILRYAQEASEFALRASESWERGSLRTEFQSRFRSWGKSSQTMRGQHRSNMETLSGPHRAQADKLNRASRTLVLADGTYVDLETGLQVPADKELMMTRAASTVWEAGARCPIFDAFIEQMVPDPEERSYLFRWLLYCLSGDTSLRCWLVNQGEGDNGKSVLWGVVQELLGDLAQKVDASVLKRNDSSHNSNRLLMRDRRLTRIEEGGRTDVDVEMIKDATGGERSYEGRYAGAARGVKVAMVSKIVVNVNGAPNMEVRDRAVRRRTIIFPWRVKVADLKDRGVVLDPLLRDKIIENELPGVLQRILREGRAVWSLGLTDSDHIPEGVKAHIRKSVKEMDPLFDAAFRGVTVMTGSRMSGSEIIDLYGTLGLPTRDTAKLAREFLGLIREVHQNHRDIRKVRTVVDRDSRTTGILGVAFDMDRFLDMDEVVNYEADPVPSRAMSQLQRSIDRLEWNAPQ